MSAETLELWMAWSDETHDPVPIFGVAQSREAMARTLEIATRRDKGPVKLRPVRITVHVREGE